MGHASSTPPQEYRKVQVRNQRILAKRFGKILGGPFLSWPLFFGKEKKRVPAPLSSPEFCGSFGFCRKVVWTVSHNRKPVEDPSYRTPKILQNFGSQTQVFGVVAQALYPPPSRYRV